MPPVKSGTWTNIALAVLVSLVIGASFFAADAMDIPRIAVPVFYAVIATLYVLTLRVRGGSHR